MVFKIFNVLLVPAMVFTILETSFVNHMDTAVSRVKILRYFICNIWIKPAADRAIKILTVDIAGFLHS